ncbi:uncharacterized protein [Nicotiana tomentosiformis]|uniref:uncharacterized protein n=1 Tax=Nicotiana tomentosiformis TaxID=4098 RepID=UPI00388C8A34
MGAYCYKVMPFGLKNAGATYQRLVTKMFQEHLGKTMELLKKQNQFEWTEECRQALKELKAYLTNPPLLSKPRDGERLFVSAVLVREDKVTAYPLRNILHKQELPGRLAKWAIELSEYDIIYQPRTAIKSHVLADFVTDFNTNIIPEVEKELQIFSGANPGTWTLFTDGSSNVKGASLGIVLIPPSGECIRQTIKCYPITNNEAEYEAVIAGLELARELSIEQIMIKSDSQLVVNQMQGTYTAKEGRMQQYLKKGTRTGQAIPIIEDRANTQGRKRRSRRVG